MYDAQLISTNKPDLVLFVGEALVGNEAVDQLVKFNKAMVDFSNDVNPRFVLLYYSSICLTLVSTIDGIVLTKFDTIDDKV